MDRAYLLHAYVKSSNWACRSTGREFGEKDMIVFGSRRALAIAKVRLPLVVGLPLVVRDCL